MIGRKPSLPALEEIGQGGMSVVYKGTDETRRLVAIKVFHPFLAQKDCRARLTREALGRGSNTRTSSKFLTTRKKAACRVKRLKRMRNPRFFSSPSLLKG